MAACKNDILLHKVNVSKLEERVEVDINVSRDLNDCRKINTKNAVSVSDTSSYSSFSIPSNQFECGAEDFCSNTGTLTFTGASAENAIYKLPWDATEYGSGAIVFYAKAASYPATITVTVSDTQAGTNADVYTVTITQADVADDGFAPVVIDLSQTPSSVEGEGWTPSASGAYVKIGGTGIGISSISVHDSVFDFALSEVVKVACMSSLGGDMSFSTLESTCVENGYDSSADPSFDVTVTGRLVTPNYFAMNPMLKKAKEVTAFDMVTAERTVEASEGYGKITLLDIAPDECGFVSVQFGKNCATDSLFTRLSIPTPVALKDNYYQVIRNADGSADILFNSALVGQELLVSYPRAASVEAYESDASALDSFHAQMSYPMTTSDGAKYRFVFRDVLVTGFPMTLSNADQEFTFTVRIQRAKFSKYRILD